MSLITESMEGNGTAWEIDPSTRESFHLWNKYVPISVTLSVAGTAQNLINATTPDQPTVNLVTNPSFETGSPPTGFTASGATLASTQNSPRTGADEIEVTPANAAANEGFYWATPSMGGGNGMTVYLAASVYVRGPSAAGTAVIQVRDSSGTLLVTGSVATLTTSYQRIQVRYLLPATAAAYRIYVVTNLQTASLIRADDMQVEVRKDGNITAYCDGSLGVNYAWVGTANASESRRRRGLAFIRGFRLVTSLAAFFAFDVDASSTTGIPIAASTTYTHDGHPLHFQRLSFLNQVGGEAPVVTGVVWGVH